MDERTFLNNNIVYTFMTHFLLKVCDTLETQSVTSNQLVIVFALCWSLEIFFFFNLFQVQGQVFSEANCANLISTLITNLINQYQNLQSDFTNRVEISKASASLNGVRVMEENSHVLHNFLKSTLSSALVWFYYNFIIQTLKNLCIYCAFYVYTISLEGMC